MDASRVALTFSKMGHICPAAVCRRSRTFLASWCMEPLVHLDAGLNACEMYGPSRVCDNIRVAFSIARHAIMDGDAIDQSTHISRPRKKPVRVTSAVRIAAAASTAS